MKRLPLGVYSLALLALGWSAVSVDLTSAQNGPKRLSEPFINVSEQAGIMATHRGEWNQFKPNFSHGYLGIGQAWGDYDNDGWLDLFVTGNRDDNILYHNNRDGTFSIAEFSDSLRSIGLHSGGALWADYDNDGWLDLLVVNNGSSILYHNEHGKGFINVTAKAGIHHMGKGTSATWGDYNGDSYLDLYVGNWSCYPECGEEPGPAENALAQDVLYRNNGNGTFTDVSNQLTYEKLLGSAFGASFVDYDNDGDVDIYVVNDMLKNPIGNVLWRNDGWGCGGWCWTDASAQANAGTKTYAMGLGIGDYDNDLDLDFYFTNIVNRMTLLQNQGDGTFVDATSKSNTAIGPSPAVGWGSAFFDYDNDGWLDLYVTTTQFVESKARGAGGAYLPPLALMDPYPDVLFKNNSNGTFSDVTPYRWRGKPEATMGIAYADYDNDGWVDYVLGEWNRGYALYRNTAQVEGNHWLTVRLVGDGAVNRDAVGARVYLTATDGLTQMQDVICGSSLGAGNDTALHFGLGNADVSQIRIVWPDRTENVLKDITSNRILNVTYPNTIQSVAVKEGH
jgi:enediyne biosynthesis protein E4